MQNASRFAKKAVSIAVTASTIAWSVGASFVPLATHAATPGSLIKMPGNPAVYYLHTDNKRYVFPNQTTYNTWYSDFSGVQTISQSELQSYAIGGNVTMRPGTKLAKITTDPKVYALEPGGTLRWIQTEAIAKALYGDNWASRVVDVPDAFFVNYKPGADLTTSTYPTGSLIKQASSSDLYYVDGSSKRKVTSAGMTANRLMASNAVVASDSIFNALSNGSDVATSESAIWSIVVGASTSTGTGLTVALASDSPSSGLLPTGSALNTVLKLNLTASSDGSVNVTGIKVKRSGFSVDSDVAGLGVYDAQGNRHGNVLTLSENVSNITFAADPIVVAAGTTTSVFVKANVSSSGNTSGTMQFGVESGGITTGATVNGSFPLNGGVFGLTNGANALGALDVDSVTISPTAVTTDIGTLAKPVGKFKLSETSSKEDVRIKRIRLFQNGNAADEDLKNITLVDTTTGTTVATVEKTSGRYANLTMDYLLAKGTNRTFEVRVDVINGSSRTVQFVIQNDYDVDVQGVSTAANLLAAHASGTDTSTGFPVGDNTTTYNSLTINAGSLTAAKDSSSRSGDIGQGESGVKLGAFKLEAIGEAIEIQKIAVDLEASSPTSDDGDLSGTLSVKVNGTTVYSVAADNNDLWDGTPAQATLSSFYTIPGGTSAILTVEGNIHSSNATAGETFIATIDDIYYKRVSSNNFDTAGTAVSGNTLTVSTASLTVSKNTAFANQSQVAGASGLKIGSYVLQAGTAEGVNVTAIAVNLSSVTGLTNLKLKKADGTQLGSTIGSPSSSSDNTFSFSLPIPISGTQVVDLFADTSTSAATVTSTISAGDVGASGSLSGSTISSVPAADVTGQTITISTGGTLAVTADAATPSQQVLHANESDVSLLNLRLSATGENVNVSKITVETANGSNNYSNLKLFNGATQLGTTVSLVDGKATFAGLSVSVPKDSALNLIVKGATNDTGTLRSADYTALGVSDIEATGAASGSQIYPATLSANYDSDTVDETESVDLSTGYTTTGFNTGDGVLVWSNNTSGGVEWGMVLSVSDSNTMVVATETDTAAAAGRFVKLPTVTTTAASAGTLLADGSVAATVTSTKGFAVGDIVLAHNTTDGVEPGMIVSIDSPTAMKIALNTDFTAAVTRVSKLSSGATTAASAGTALAAGTAAVTVTSTTGFAVGDAVYVRDATNVHLGMVITIDSSTAMKIATEADMAGAASRVTKLATFETTAASAGTPLDSGAAVTVTTNAGFAQNDPVIAFNATDGVEIGIASAVSGAASVTVATKTDMTAAASRVSRLWGLTATSNPFVIHDVEPIVALNASSPSGSSSGSANQVVARFNITAGGYRDLTIKTILLTRGGNIGANVATSAVPRIYVNGDLKGTGATWSGTTSGSTSAVTLTSPYTITAGQTATFEVQVDTSSAVATNTFQVYIDGTASVEQGSGVGLGWYYDVSASSPGFSTAPTNGSPATIMDTYPVFGNTLTY